MKKTVRFMALIMTIFMLFTVAACGKDGTENTSVPEFNAGDEVIDDIVDDDDTVNNKKPAVNSSNKDNTAESYDDNLDRKHKVDENKKKALLESVPENLKGQEVSILTWWNPFEYEKKKMEKFTQETGIKIKWVYADMENYTQRLASLRAQGNAPDIACIRPGDYPSSIMQDYFRPLSKSKLDLSKGR